jgi:hypothetical protein
VRTNHEHRIIMMWAIHIETCWHWTIMWKCHWRFVHVKSRIYNMAVLTRFRPSSNGRTRVFGSRYQGSNP